MALEHVPTLVLCTATSAWVEAHSGNPEAARADILLTRRNLAYVDKVTSWLSITARIALAEASLLLGDRVGTRMFLEDVTAALDTLPRDRASSRPRRRHRQSTHHRPSHAARSIGAHHGPASGAALPPHEPVDGRDR